MVPRRWKCAIIAPLEVMENDVDAAALAEQAHGHGRHASSFAFVTVGTGIGMGLVLDGRLHRGAHGIHDHGMRHDPLLPAI